MFHSPEISQVCFILDVQFQDFGVLCDCVRCVHPPTSKVTRLSVSKNRNQDKLSDLHHHDWLRNFSLYLVPVAYHAVRNDVLHELRSHRNHPELHTLVYVLLILQVVLVYNLHHSRLTNRGKNTRKRQDNACQDHHYLR